MIKHGNFNFTVEENNYEKVYSGNEIGVILKSRNQTLRFICYSVKVEDKQKLYKKK